MISTLKNELDNQRPVLYAGGTTSLTTGNKSGHWFICDGYASDNTFHFNLGWGGRCNGFYDCSDFMTDYYEINPVEWTIGIEPNWQQSTTVTLPATTIGTTPLTTNETWQASSIVAGSATNTPFVVPSGDNGRLVAVNSVKLLSGFKASAGSTFLARLYENNTGGLKSYIETMNDPIVTEQSELGEISIVDNSALSIDANPNPITNGNLTISASKEILGKVTIEIYDLVGQKVYTSKEDGLITKQINFSNFAKGIYMLKVSYNNNNVFTTKVLY